MNKKQIRLSIYRFLSLIRTENRIYYIIALIMLNIITIPKSSNAETITIVADRWCPYNCEPESQHPGFMIEMAQKAFAKHNITVKYSVVPWTRAIEETRLNKHTAIVGSAHRDAPDFVFPNIPQGWMRNSFYIKKEDSWTFTGTDSLAKIALGIISDYSYNTEMDDYIAKHKDNSKLLQPVSGDNALETNVNKLLSGRIGALIDGEYVITHYLAEHKLENKIKIAGSLSPSENDNLFIAFSPKEPKAKFYAEILEKETQIMRESGELSNILSSYNLTDWKK